MWPLNTMETLTLLYLLSTVAYTAVTFLLWRVTKGSLDSVRNATYGTTLQGIAANHRELAFRALGSAKLQDTFMSVNPPDGPLDAETRLFAGVLINHLETLYEHCRFGTVPKEFREPLLNDIRRTTSGIPALRRRWKEMEQQLEPEFRNFVSTALREAKA